MAKSDNDHTNWLSTDPWSDVGQSIGGFFSSGGEAMQPGQAGYQSRFASRLPSTSAGAVVQGPVQGPRTPRRPGWSGGGWGSGSGFEWGGSRSTNNARARQSIGTGLTAAAAQPTGFAARGRTPTANAGPYTGGQVAQTGPQRMAAAQAKRAATPLSQDRQRRVDIQAGHQTSVQKAADPLNWKGIARDLGNAGVAAYSGYKSGGRASTRAKSFARVEQIKALPASRKPNTGRNSPR